MKQCPKEKSVFAINKLVASVLRYTVHACLPPPARFAIITGGRTGSNLLMSLLNSHPAIRQHGEVIGEWLLQRQDIKAEILALGPVPYVERWFRWRIIEPVVGIKILYYQLENEYARKWGIEGLPAVLDFLKSSRDIKIIHLKRRNRLKTLASFRLAEKTSQFKLLSEAKRVNGVQIKLDETECNHAFRWIGQLEREYDEAFCHHEMLEVYYEDLVAHKECECDRILEFLGVRRRLLKSRMLQQNNRPLAEIIENYAALKRHFEDTEWKRYFEE